MISSHWLRQKHLVVVVVVGVPPAARQGDVVKTPENPRKMEEGLPYASSQKIWNHPPRQHC